MRDVPKILEQLSQNVLTKVLPPVTDGSTTVSRNPPTIVENVSMEL